FTTIKLTKQQQTAWIKLNRPKKMNAINTTMRHELTEALDKTEQNNSIRCIIITGEGNKTFCAGADVTEFQQLTQETAAEFSRKGQQIFSTIEAISKPVIATINGYALGGGLELALACDFRLASDKAILGLPEMKLGIIPGWGGTQRLPWTIGIATAKRMILLGDSINAMEALKIGLVDKVVPQNQLKVEEEKLAQRLCEWSPAAVKEAKAAVNYVTKSFLESGLRKETDLFALLFSKEETKNRIQSFLGQENKKRKTRKSE
ncbi:MAG TPA: enoyl-CoA hydratase/isomerase family protein, partial [Acidobacteriota bacterium]|nr:enoyl-CoA hydratase/isomerase family protein [Acidobacteriota bacterium]